MKRKEILEEAMRCVCADRQDQYGSPENNFRLIADLWNKYVGVSNIKPRDVAAMLALLKIARIRNGVKDDNWVDLAGYAACGGELDDQKPKTAS